MGWSYDTGLSTELDRVRFLIGDTDLAHPQLQDEEILFLVSSSGSSTSAAAAAACRGLAARYARRVHEEVGDLKLYNEQMFDHYVALAEQLSAQGSLASVAGLLAVPSAGGIYVADKDAYAANDGLVQSSFSRNMHDYE